VTTAANASLIANADAFAAKAAPVIREAQAAGARSLRAIGAALDERGFRSRHGKPWSPIAVSNVLKRIGALTGA
jgi:hypothetical protein